MSKIILYDGVAHGDLPYFIMVRQKEMQAVMIAMWNRINVLKKALEGGINGIEWYKENCGYANEADEEWLTEARKALEGESNERSNTEKS